MAGRDGPGLSPDCKLEDTGSGFILGLVSLIEYVTVVASENVTGGGRMLKSRLGYINLSPNGVCVCGGGQVG